MPEKPEWIEDAKENIANNPMPSYFANEVLIASALKEIKEKGKRNIKEAYIHFSFIDFSNRQPVCKVVISYSTAKGLLTVVERQLKDLEEKLGKKDL